jgi:type IV pilus assembly protein PilY1
VRPGVHGDVLHSRPLALNYNTGTDSGIVVYYGSNDGSFRAVRGGNSGSDAGRELWSFIAPEHLTQFKRLRDNAPSIRLSTTPAAALSAQPRDYFVDGPIAAYQKFNADGSINTAHLFFGMRRGGRVLYSLDVTDPTAPKFRWKKSAADIVWSVGGSSYAMGQTWSEPKVASAMVGGVVTRVVIMGARYDAAAEDAATPGATTMGNAVVVLDATSGTLLKAFATLRSVPADVTLIDSNNDGLVDRVYAIDVGGNLYRIDLGSSSGSAIADWGMYRVASLGDGARKFFFAPDVVLTDVSSALMAGSGDREKPLRATAAASDGFFTVYDTRLARGTPAIAPAVIDSASLGLVGSGDDMSLGCYIAMGASEKIVNAPLTVDGTTYFGTNAPTPASANSCDSNLGHARLYTAPAFCKVAARFDLTGGGLPPSPDAGIVHVDYVLPDGHPASKNIRYIIGAPNSKNSAIEVSKVLEGASSNALRRRLYWFLEGAR